ncbi:hypothetical protein [Caproiciproducens galactitolivorans]|uniref:Transposase n=1 Tax=Caproiciproducens galactitolivorans TaxID=642589 RepID=A0A4Z0XVK1_9FIRM|nr:hypothetical protein [Caproiciproducens galactitolivorans]TGJ75449.1 hypothetical protein CAGA_23980 [Caproiciproducens galactitolivorans]
MPRKYTKLEMLSEVFRRKVAGETNREIGESYGLTKYQIKQFGQPPTSEGALDCQRV